MQRSRRRPKSRHHRAGFNDVLSGARGGARSTGCPDACGTGGGYTHHMQGWYDFHGHRPWCLQRSRRRAESAEEPNCRGRSGAGRGGHGHGSPCCRSLDIGRSSGCREIVDGFEIGAHCNRRQYRSDRSDCQVQGRYLLEVATPLRDLFEPRWGRRMADGDSVTIGG